MSVRLIPPQTPLTEPYWQGAQQGKLKIQACQDCGARQFPPSAHCQKCGSGSLAWKDVSGRGSVYTFTVAERPPHPIFVDHCPMVIAVVELEEGPRMMTNVAGCEPNEVSIGMAVVVDFDPIDDSETVLPVFRPA